MRRRPQLGPAGGLVAAEIWGHRLARYTVSPLAHVALLPDGACAAPAPARLAKLFLLGHAVGVLEPGPPDGGGRDVAAPVRCVGDDGAGRTSAGRPRRARLRRARRVAERVAQALGQARLPARRRPGRHASGTCAATVPRGGRPSGAERLVVNEKDPPRLRVLEVSYSRQVWGAELATMALAGPLARRGIDLTLAVSSGRRPRGALAPSRPALRRARLPRAPGPAGRRRRAPALGARQFAGELGADGPLGADDRRRGPGLRPRALQQPVGPSRLRPRRPPGPASRRSSSSTTWSAPGWGAPCSPPPRAVDDGRRHQPGRGRLHRPPRRLARPHRAAVGRPRPVRSRPRSRQPPPPTHLGRRGPARRHRGSHRPGQGRRRARGRHGPAARRGGRAPPGRGGQRGLAPDGYPERVRAEAERTLGDRVRFVGRTSDVPGTLRALDILVNASVAEPFGLSVLEAAGLGGGRHRDPRRGHPGLRLRR